jgi:glycosyltransferase involved in cell wall biosynthesis
MKDINKISVVIPCYYNQDNIPVTISELKLNETIFPEEVAFEYILVDDGSRDNTWQELKKVKFKYPNQITIIKLAGNVGSYTAILAGLAEGTGDCYTVLAADLQDPPALILKMYNHWKNGTKLIMANRQDREDPLSQRLFSNTYHFLMRKLAIKDIPKGGFDFVLFDKQLKEEVVKMQEKNTNTLYLLPWMGYEYVTIPYVRKKRQIGESKWTVSKKVKLFIDSFVSFSFFPLRAISFSGILLGIISFLYGFFVIFAKLFNWINIDGWSTLMTVTLFIGSFQMIALGIIGEYVWRGLDASRNRPNFIVEEKQ